ncbi:MAG: GTP-binding protein, partial [Deltaproteobacteria bacterium]|nr:GTP-binding protein [Deltaproteobacteria bacterium]
MKTAKLDKENIDDFLNRHLQKELLRFVTVGSVDDGKSTLIGRLLHDTESVYLDQLESVKKSTGRGLGEEMDLSLITDGLKAEREQGITIDVAYRYFTTEKRKFILADTPGHVQYTRNMATGASTADVAIILIDARLGVQVQSRRHAFIASLLGIPHLAVCINKMDLKDYDQKVFEAIKKDFIAFAKPLGFKGVTTFPISALKGDNVVLRSEKTPWHTGGTLLEFLETVPIETWCEPQQRQRRGEGEAQRALP